MPRSGPGPSARRAAGRGSGRWKTGGPSSNETSIRGRSPNRLVLRPRIRDERDGADLDQELRRGELADLDQRRCRRYDFPELAAHFLHALAVADVLEVDVDAAHVVERAAGGFDCAADVLAHLAR